MWPRFWKYIWDNALDIEYQEEGKKLKKRYAVFNFDKSLAELKELF